MTEIKLKKDTVEVGDTVYYKNGSRGAIFPDDDMEIEVDIALNRPAIGMKIGDKFPCGCCSILAIYKPSDKLQKEFDKNLELLYLYKRIEKLKGMSTHEN